MISKNTLTLAKSIVKHRKKREKPYICFMKTYQINIINPKAVKLLQDLADLDLITFKETEDTFQNVIKSIRKKASANQPSLEEITKEVEIVRAKRYAEKIGL